MLANCVRWYALLLLLLKILTDSIRIGSRSFLWNVAATIFSGCHRVGL